MALNLHTVLADESSANYLVASPNAFNPPGVGDSGMSYPDYSPKRKKKSG
ncbi:hypothetical protein P4S72_16225 [Vibrio sp. PP-XX7]